MNEFNLMETYRTLRGFTLAEAARELTKILPPDAYKAVPGASDFTDIDPAYLTKEATRVFGVCGVGWWYEYEPGLVDHWTENKVSQKGREYTTHEVIVPYLVLRYAYTDQNGNVLVSNPVISQGANGNENYGYALRGAVTNAIGSAFAKLGWQLLVYLGKLNHRNAAAKYEAQQKNAGSNGGNGNGTDSQVPTAAEVVREALAEVAAESAAAPAPEQLPEPTEQLADGVQSGIAPDRMEKIKYAHAGQHVILEGLGIPLAGKTLAVAKKDARYGKGIITYLAGKGANKEGNTFEPADAAQKALHEAAIIIYEKDGYANK